MTWAPKPRNWRQYSGWYHPPGFRASAGNVAGNVVEIERAYVDWLAKARGWSVKEAATYCDAMDKRRIISQVTAPDGPLQEASQSAYKRLASERKRAQRAYVAATQAANRKRMAALTVSPVPFGPPPPDNVLPLRTPTPARKAIDDGRRCDAAALLRELAGGCGPRRAHKLRAIADFLDTAPVGASRRTER